MAGHTIRLAAINWYGANTPTYVMGGLDSRPYLSILRTIKYLGFNTIRVPFSNALVEHNPVVTKGVEANPWFRGQHALAILDAVINGARQVGLMVVLDNHCSDPVASLAHQEPLWYDLPHYTPQSWVRDWLTMARRYRNNPAVVGFDLRNEPHTDGPGLEILGLAYLHQGATWGPFQGVDNPASDWRLAAQQAGDAILAVDPHVLIMVEGVEVAPMRNPLHGSLCPFNLPATGAYCADLYWWAGNFSGVRQYPVVLALPHHLVYSPHEYGPAMHGQRWIKPHMGAQDWLQAIDRHWGFLLNATGPNAAPVWIGEFGTFTHVEAGARSQPTSEQGRWFSTVVHYLQQHPNAGWAYWALNGAHSPASYGLLDAAWTHLSRPPLLRALQSIQP